MHCQLIQFKYRLKVEIKINLNDKLIIDNKKLFWTTQGQVAQGINQAQLLLGSIVLLF